MKNRKDGLPVGICRTTFGWRAYIRVFGALHSKRFPPNTSQRKMLDWRAAIRVDAIRAAARRGKLRGTPGTLAGDVSKYLQAVRTMPTFEERADHLQRWIDAFGVDRLRMSITGADIRAVLQQWRIDGKRLTKRVQDWRTRRWIKVEIGRAPLSDSACNRRRTALMHLFSVLDGPNAANPVKEVPKFREPEPQPRGVPYATLKRILGAMPDSATKARASVLTWTGLPPSSLKLIRPEDVKWDDQAVYVQRRRKGTGTKARTMPLLPQAVEAFRAIERWDAWGKFSHDSLRHSVHRACVALNLPKIRVYDLRHSFASAVYAATGDIRAVQALLDHRDIATTERYTVVSIDPRARAALRLFADTQPQADTPAGSGDDSQVVTR